MNSILQTEKECYITHSTTNLHLHHIYGGTANRKVSEKMGFKVYLRADWHTMAGYGVHSNPDLDRRLREECQRMYETKHSREDFIKLIGRSYL